MDKARKLIRPNPRVPVIWKDRERKPVLDALVKILKTHVFYWRRSWRGGLKRSRSETISIMYMKSPFAR
ncbi:MAG: hypothetical protein ACYCWK_05980 [Cuniculiplasma sp.]